MGGVDRLRKQRPRAEALASLTIDYAIRVHRELGPGLLESTYRNCLLFEYEDGRIPVVSEKPIPLIYRGRTLDVGFRADVIVEDHLLLELKAVEKLLPVHVAQTITYLKLTNLPLALLINFNVPLLKDGIRRIIHPDLLNRSD